VNGVQTLASCVHDATKAGSGAISPWEVDWGQPIALLVGNEGTGLPEEILYGADARIHIPMARGVESLNAAAAAAVLFYEAYRQRAAAKQ
jgi:RNA methyltransferase, TrmH family